MQGKKKKVAAGTALLAGLLLLIWFMDESEISIWAPTTIPYDPDCRNDCVDVEMGRRPHIEGIDVHFEPDVDDPIAQWGRCLDDVMACLIEHDFDDSRLPDCVSRANCPAACQTRFSETSTTIANDEIMAHFESMFVDEGGYCVPEDES